jgi:hypothetical protein
MFQDAVVDRRLGGMMRQSRGTCATMAVRALVLNSELIDYIRPEMMKQFEDIYLHRTRCGDARIPSIIINEYCYAEGQMLKLPGTKMRGGDVWTPFVFDETGLKMLHHLMKSNDIEAGLISVKSGAENHSMFVKRIGPIVWVHDSNNPDRDTRWLLANTNYTLLRYMWVAVPTGPKTTPSLEVLRQARMFYEQGSDVAKGYSVDAATEQDVDAESDEDLPYVVPGRPYDLKFFDRNERRDQDGPQADPRDASEPKPE